MSKVYKLRNPLHGTSTEYADVERDTDCHKCVICQEQTDELLQSLSRSTDGPGCKTLAYNLLAFKKINCLPPSSLMFLCWQKVKIWKKPAKPIRQNGMTDVDNKTKLERAVKWQTHSAESIDAPIAKKYACRSSSTSSNEAEECFFCGEPARIAEVFHHASTFGLDAHVSHCALQIIKIYWVN